MLVLILRFLILASFGFTIVSDSDKGTQQLVSTSNLFNLRFPQERVYLHLDRPSYWVDEDIWFKAYVKNSPINECNLYVELINPSGTVVLRNTCWVQNGLSYGDMHLPDTLTSGIYQLRAYTNWMRNFDNQWFFCEELVVSNPANTQRPGEVIRLKTRHIDLQFFPEGGSFVTGVKNKVAFKAVDNNGKGIDFSGHLTDGAGNPVAEVESRFKGIGSIVFTPEKGKRYTVEAIFPGNVRKSESLPKAKDEGVTLSINSLDSTQIEVQIYSKFTAIDVENEYLLIGQSGGYICYQKRLKTDNGVNVQRIDKNKLPGGIIQFTLFDSNLVPLCERLVYNKPKDLIKLLIKTEKQAYKPHEKVKLGVAAIAQSGKACLSNLSISVYNTTKNLTENDYPNNLYTHFLLNSELKGNIESPGYYIKDDSLSTQLALDNLLLTHGYREFNWEVVLNGAYPEIKFQPESSIQLKGRVVSSATNTPVANGKVTMMTVKGLLETYETQTDSLGNFVFQDLFFYDTLFVSLQALNKRRNRNTIIEIDANVESSPKTSSDVPTYEYSDSTLQKFTNLNEIRSIQVKKKWGFEDTIIMQELNVVAHKKEKDEHPKIYTNVGTVYDVNLNDSRSGSILDAIEGIIPGVYKENESFYARGQSVKFYMDNMEVGVDVLEQFPVELIDKVEYVKMPITVGINYSGGIIFIYPKRGMKNTVPPNEMSRGMESVKIIGYSVSRKFYSPKYDEANAVENKVDYRNTLYWNPVLRTDSTGIAVTGFYNSDEVGEIKIVVEGLTSDGKLCRGVSGYSVK